MSDEQNVKAIAEKVAKELQSDYPSVKNATVEEETCGVFALKLMLESEGESSLREVLIQVADCIKAGERAEAFIRERITSVLHGLPGAVYIGEHFTPPSS